MLANLGARAYCRQGSTTNVIHLDHVNANRARELVMTVVTYDADRLIILAQKHWATETIEAVYVPAATHIFDKGGYRYEVRIIGGKNHLGEIRCPNHDSAIRLFEYLVLARVHNLDVSWLFT